MIYYNLYLKLPVTIEILVEVIMAYCMNVNNRLHCTCAELEANSVVQ